MTEPQSITAKYDTVYTVDMRQEVNPFSECAQFSCPRCERDGSLELRGREPTGRVYCDRHGVFYMTAKERAAVRNLEDGTL